MNENDLFWQVVYVDLKSDYRSVDGLFMTEEEACEQRAVLTKEREYDDSFDYYRLDNKWVYKIRVVTRADLEVERQRRIEERLADVRTSFWQHCCGEDFVEACRKHVAWMAECSQHLTEESLRRYVEAESTFHAPWRDFHGNLKVFAYISYCKPQSLSVWGLLAGNTLGGSPHVLIRRFDCCGDFVKWVGSRDDAVAEFVSKMRTERLSKDEICNVCRYYHLNACMNGRICLSLPSQ